MEEGKIYPTTQIIEINSVVENPRPDELLSWLQDLPAHIYLELCKMIIEDLKSTQI